MAKLISRKKKTGTCKICGDRIYTGSLNPKWFHSYPPNDRDHQAEPMEKKEDA